MNIGIDISLNSTAVYITEKNIILSYLNETKVSKWAKEIENDSVIIKRIKYDGSEKYTDREINKLINYNELSDTIVNDIYNIVKDEQCDVRIEGYSFSKQTSSLVDIVALSTLIRLKILNKLNSKITIMAPMTLKVETCKKAYGYTIIKKYHKKSGKELADEILLKNDEGISGGKFTKIEMYKSLLKLELNSTFHKYIIENSEKILSLKKIPSPIDDIIDAILLSLV